MDNELRTLQRAGKDFSYECVVRIGGVDRYVYFHLSDVKMIWREDQRWADGSARNTKISFHFGDGNPISIERSPAEAEEAINRWKVARGLCPI